MTTKIKKLFRKILPRKILLVAVDVAVILSIASLFIVYKVTDRNMRKSLLAKTENVAAVINVDEVMNLTGSEKDIGSHDYEHLKEIMTDVHFLNPETRFVYLMGYRDGLMFFFVDSEAPESEDYSPPGDVYYDTTVFEVYNFIKGVSFTEGPYTDDWGTWVSAYAPLFDDSGKPVAIVGMDVDVVLWNKKLWHAELYPLSAAIFFIIFIIFYYSRVDKPRS